MASFNFYKAFTLLRELGEPGGDPGGGPPMDGPAPSPPMGGGGGPPMGGGPPGGDPMGGGAPGGGEPIEVKSLPAADVWKLLEKLVKDEKYGKFFEEINIAKNREKSVTFSPKKKTGLMK